MSGESEFDENSDSDDYFSRYEFEDSFDDFDDGLDDN